MPIFEVCSCSGHIHDAKYLGETREFPVSSESSEPIPPLTIRPGDLVLLDTDASGNRELFIGCKYNCEGAWFNHKNNNPARMTFHAHKAVVI